jgi:hypothetical protein
VRDPDEIARRERIWDKAIQMIELGTGHEAGAIPAEDFRALLAQELDLTSFRPRPRLRAARASSSMERSHV